MTTPKSKLAYFWAKSGASSGHGDLVAYLTAIWASFGIAAPSGADGIEVYEDGEIVVRAFDFFSGRMRAGILLPNLTVRLL